MALTDIVRDNGHISWGWIGKGVAAAIIAGIPAMVATGIYIAVRLAVLESGQAAALKAIADSQEAIRVLNERVWVMQNTADRAAIEAERARVASEIQRREIAARLGEVKNAVKDVGEKVEEKP